MKAVILKIEGLHCDGCVERMQTVLARTQGVREAAVSFNTGEGRVRYNPHATTVDYLIRAIEVAGFSARVSGNA